MEALSMIKQAFREESMSRTRKAQTHRDCKKAETGEHLSQEHVIISLTPGVFFHKEFALAGQTVSTTFYCDVLRRMRENVQRLRSELWRQNNCPLQSRQRTASLLIFHQGIFLPKNKRSVVPTHPTFLFPQLNIKLKGTIEVITAEWQEVLNTISEHDFKDAFKKWQKLRER
jgi:hypothetical protein